MSILIKGLKMPRDCPMCPLSHWNRLDEFTGCEVVNGKRFAVTTDEGYAQSDTRPIWCPLVEMPSRADVVEVVRCKDCKYNPRNPRSWGDDDIVEHYLWCEFMAIESKYNYCSKGKRSEE